MGGAQIKGTNSGAQKNSRISKNNQDTRYKVKSL